MTNYYIWLTVVGGGNEHPLTQGIVLFGLHDMSDET